MASLSAVARHTDAALDTRRRREVAVRSNAPEVPGPRDERRGASQRRGCRVRSSTLAPLASGDGDGGSITNDDRPAIIRTSETLRSLWKSDGGWACSGRNAQRACRSDGKGAAFFVYFFLYFFFVFLYFPVFCN